MRESFHRRDATRSTVRLIIDVSLAVFGFAVAGAYRVGLDAMLGDADWLIACAAFLAVAAIGFSALRTSIQSWRFVSARDLLIVVRDVTVVIVVFVAMSFVVSRLDFLPRSAPLIAWFVIAFLLCGVRAIVKLNTDGALSIWAPELGDKHGQPMLIYGADAQTDSFLRAFRSTGVAGVRAVGMIDDDPKNRLRKIQSLKVLGGTKDLARIVDNIDLGEWDNVLLVLPSSSLDQRRTREILEAASTHGLRMVQMPDAQKIIESGHAFTFEQIKLTDLLARDPIELRLTEIDGLVRGKTVVVTGAGGSIGSEICRQVMMRDPARMIAIDHSEFNLFMIEQELANQYDPSKTKFMLASVRERERIFEIFRRERVELVLHAAAYKHVPLIEANPLEGIFTNVLGTVNVADAAGAANATAMVMISTDKAVRPSSIMGLTKRVAEMYCQSLDGASEGKEQATRFVTVRFGNVLGSSGSVVPIFERQIRNGGPVTVTHREMVRFFMTIPEAVQVVLQATLHGLTDDDSRSAVLVLDMGRPVRIVDLARRMIVLAGKMPDRDIKVAFTGMRPGEKLYEELFDANEAQEQTRTPGIRLARSRVPPIDTLTAALRAMALACQRGDQAKGIDALESLLERHDPVRQVTARGGEPAVAGDGG